MKKMIRFVSMLCLMGLLLSVSALAAEEPACTGPGEVHTYQVSKIIEPTCTTDGRTMYACITCEHPYSTEYGLGISTAYQDPDAYAFKQRLNYLCTYSAVEYGIEYMIFTVNPQLTPEQDWSTIVQVPGDEYEEVVRAYFAVTDEDIEAIRNYVYDPMNKAGLQEHALAYDGETHTYSIQRTGGFGGAMGSRTYQGYVINGDTFDVYYADTEYLFLQDLLPEGQDAWAYHEALGNPATFQYDGYTFRGGPDGPYCVKSVADTGRKVTVEYNEEIVRILDCVDYTAEDVPEAYDDRDGKATGHCWDKGVISILPTAEKEGAKVFTCQNCGCLRTDTLPMTDEGNAKFHDVPHGAWYEKPVDWAVEKGITGGVGDDSFGPDRDCTRAQVMTFLWRAAGSPAPKSMENAFADVREDDYYYAAVLWAVEQGITGGIGEDSFGPDQACTRAQVATFLWAAMGKPEAKGSTGFSDVKTTDWYAQSVKWAAENKITGGIGGGKFGPNNTCTRSQVVTFLYKVYG